MSKWHLVWIYPLPASKDLVVNELELKELKKKFGSRVNVLKVSDNREDLIVKG